MNEESGFVPAGTQQMHYLRWGTGPRLLLAFHGYGNDASIFSPFRKYLENNFTILSFDLPYHGKSKWQENIELTKEVLASIVGQVMKEYKAEKISLLGYSMGSRVCLTIVEAIPQAIDRVALAAADGLTINMYYYFLTRTAIGKKLFSNMLARPERFFKVINWLHRKKLVNTSRHRFVTHYLASDESRRFLLRVWPGMRLLIPSPTKLKRLIKQYSIHIAIFMGMYDRIMPPSLGKNFMAGLDTVQLHILEKGHRVFDYDNAQQIAQSLL